MVFPESWERSCSNFYAHDCNYIGGHRSQWKKLKWIIGTHGHWKNKNPEAILELPAKQHCQFSLFTAKMVQMGQIGSVYLAASKRPPPFWFFSIAMGDDYSFELVSIVHWVPHFFIRDKSILDRMITWQTHTIQCMGQDISLKSERNSPWFYCTHNPLCVPQHKINV